MGQKASKQLDIDVNPSVRDTVLLAELTDIFHNNFDVAVVKDLIFLGADVNARYKTNAITIVAPYFYYNSIKNGIKKYKLPIGKIKIDHKNNTVRCDITNIDNKITLLHVCVIVSIITSFQYTDSVLHGRHSRLEEIMDYLVSHGADVNAVDANGNTALHYIVQSSHIELAQILVATGTDINICNKDGDDVYTIAYKYYQDLMKIQILGAIMLQEKNKKSIPTVQDKQDKQNEFKASKLQQHLNLNTSCPIIDTGIVDSVPGIIQLAQYPNVIYLAQYDQPRQLVQPSAPAQPAHPIQSIQNVQIDLPPSYESAFYQSVDGSVCVE
ncbi:MAG: hypothetical protein Faunusvirus1_44 [Faunusvirus sp.]|jgi:hypothetical protein|uniref:Uncharacterized protein n=1 Tax=Faunusvirus sp. TaxID=2487766 RepID=A0A3G4ZXF6_9VIRU|nr:MAG: hypothetical protein Faunusvirus1_44 [Faunusvirus sp.]